MNVYVHIYIDIDIDICLYLHINIHIYIYNMYDPTYLNSICWRAVNGFPYHRLLLGSQRFLLLGPLMVNPPLHLHLPLHCYIKSNYIYKTHT